MKVKGLIIKDLLNLSSYKTTLLIILIFCSIGMVGTDAVNAAPIFITVMIGMIVLSTFNYDEASHAEKYILSLPLTRKEIVMSKYVLAIVANILGSIVGILLTIIIVNVINVIRPEDLIKLDFENLSITAVSGIFGVALIQAIQIPSVYRFGAEKGRIQMFLLLFLLVLMIAGVGFLITKIGFDINIEKINRFMNHFGIPILILVSAILYYISYKISYKIFKKKEY